MFCCTVYGSALSAQGSRDSVQRVFFENYFFVTEPLINEGSEFTTARYSRGAISRGMYLLPVADRYSLLGGVGLGLRGIEQRSTRDRYVCETGPTGRDCSVGFDYVMEAQHTAVFVDLPLQFRASLGRGRRGLYLGGGSSLQLPVYSTTEVYRSNDSGTESFVRDDVVRTRITHLWSAAVGYQRLESEGRSWYLELTYAWSSNQAISNEVGLLSSGGDPQYLQSARLRQLGFTGGVNF